VRNICNICNICKCPFRHKVETFGTAVSLETALHILTFSVLIFHLYINLNNYIDTTHQLVDQVVQSVQRLATGWTVRGSNPGGGEIFRTFPDRPWGPPSLPYNGYRIFPGVKERPGRDAEPSPPSSAVVKKRVEIYLYSHYGSYGLYRDPESLQGCTLHFVHQLTII